MKYFEPKKNSHLPYNIRSYSKYDFIIISFLIHALIFFFKRKKKFRTSKFVKHAYDLNRKKLKIHESLFKTCFGEKYKSNKCFVLDNDKIHYSQPYKIKLKIIKLIEKIISKNSKKKFKILELGCGFGINIFLLAKRYPKLKFYGCDISKVSIDKCRAIAKKFNIKNAEFFVHDLNKPFPKKIKSRIDYIYSHIALEQISSPYLNKVISNIFELDAKYYNFFEPDTYLWGYNLRGITSKLRSNHMDRLKNLLPSLKEQLKKKNYRKFRVIEARRSGFGTNPHVEVSNIKIIKY